MPAAARWYKGNLHMHSFWSDGQHFPEVIAERFKSHGYHFIAFTEHDQHQVGDRWISTDPAEREGRLLRDGNLLAEYIDRFGADWVERRSRGAAGITDVRLKPLHEYRHLLEEPERFLILNGEEITVTWAGGKHYINTVQAPQVVPPQTTSGSSASAMQMTVDATDRLTSESGRPIITSLNHPNFRWNATAEDIAAVRGLRFMEVHTALNSCLSYGDAVHPGAERIWDIVLSLRLAGAAGASDDILYGLANDDCHSYHDVAGPAGDDVRAAHPFRARMMVRAPRLTPDSITAAMHRGDFYGTTGVTLRSLEYTADSLAVSVDPEPDVHYTIRFIGTRRGADLRGTPATADDGAGRVTRRYSDSVGATLKEVEGPEASYRLTGDELYVRALVLTDKPHPNPTVPGDVQKAWTQPVVPTRG